MAQREPFTLYHDARGTWYAVPPGFRGILRDPLGRGKSPSKAIRDLCTHPEFVHRAGLGEWCPSPRRSAFVECGSMDLSATALPETDWNREPRAGANGRNSVGSPASGAYT